MGKDNPENKDNKSAKKFSPEKYNMVLCPVCDGKGKVPKSPKGFEVCTRCGGFGFTKKENGNNKDAERVDGVSSLWTWPPGKPYRRNLTQLLQASLFSLQPNEKGIQKYETNYVRAAVPTGLVWYFFFFPLKKNQK